MNAGRMLAIPTGARPGHPLAAELGFECFARVCYRLGGARIYVPKGRPHGRNLRIRREHAEGASAATIAARYRLSVRHVRSILAAA